MSTTFEDLLPKAQFTLLSEPGHTLVKIDDNGFRNSIRLPDGQFWSISPLAEVHPAPEPAPAGPGPGPGTVDQDAGDSRAAMSNLNDSGNKNTQSPSVDLGRLPGDCIVQFHIAAFRKIVFRPQ